MDKENPKARHNKRPHKRRKIDDESSKSNGVINLLEEQPEEIVNGLYFTPDAFSCGDVLENIFRYLNGKDLESCRLVNKRWKYVVGQFYTRYYEVTIRPPQLRHSRGEKKITVQNHVIIQKLYWTSQRTDKKKFSFPEAVALLLKKSANHWKFAIDLAIEIPLCPPDQQVESFLSKIGHLIHEFTPSSGEEFLDPMCRLTRSYFPNLSYLNLSAATIRFFGGQSWEDFNEYLKENVLDNLRKISFGHSLDLFETTDCFMKMDDSLKAAESFIKVAPNLKEIHEFPVHLVDALISTGKNHLVKSVCYPNNKLIGEGISDDNEVYGQIFDITLEVALKKFAQLEPKLISFNFSLFYHSLGWEECEDPYPFNYLYQYCLKPSICQILESSLQSLETLTLHPTASFDFEEISPMTSLKKIIFVYSQPFDNFLSFTTKFDLERVFPNVTTVEIAMYFSDTRGKYDPLRLLSPWGSRIKELILTGSFDLDSNTIRPLAQSFPSLNIFKFIGYRRISPDTLMVIFPLIANSWPEMEVISIKLEDECGQRRGNYGYTFDSMFTGIRKECLTRLKTPKSKNNIPKDELDRFYRNSTIRKLSNLKRLELDFRYWSVGAREKFLGKLSRITVLSKDFGFDFLPPTFKIAIREKGPQSIFEVQRDLKKIQQDLSSVVALEFETIQEEE